MTDPNSDPLVGRIVGQYQILARVGGGGMGVVYTARDTRLTRIVALKFLPPQWSHDATAKERFVREAQAASATNHPNICTIHDIETADDGQLFIVMAYYEGQTLKTRLESGPLAIEEALDIATQVADGLARAHAQGVVHRDIKPGNLILTEDGVRILDFGLATFADALKLTVENAPLGTIAYMSPEQVRGQQADARADVWATGAVLYEMLTGHAPFRGSHAEAIGYAVRNEQPTPIREERPEVPEEVEHLVFRALHKEPGVRFASGREMARALRQVRGLSVPIDLRTAPVSAPDVRDIRPHDRRRRAAIAAVLALAAIALAGWWLLRPVPRTVVVIAPVINETGTSSLEAYRLALTETITEQLVGSSAVRVVPYAWVSRILSRFTRDGMDVSSRAAVQALAATGAEFILEPTLLHENGAWWVRLDIKAGDTSTTSARLETDRVLSPLPKETVYRLVSELAGRIEDHFSTARGRMQRAIVKPIRGDRESMAPVVATLDAAEALERGIRAYEDVEYAASQDHFAKAVEEDPRSPLAWAWLGRVAALIGQKSAANDAAARAIALLKDRGNDDHDVWSRALAAEAQRDFAAADLAVRQLVEHHPDDPTWLIELADLHGRRGQNGDAIVTFTRAAALDSHLLRPHLEMCRLYNSLNDTAKAREHADIALAGYRALGEPAGEAQTHLCLAELLRVGGQQDQKAALEHAQTAVTLLEDLKFPYGIARAHNYVALAFESQGRLADAAAAWETALTGALETRNVVLQQRVLNNLGVVHEAMGNPSRAAEYYRKSYELNERLGADRDAAISLANASAIQIEYGPNPDEGLRAVSGILPFFENLHDRNFEILCRLLIAAYHRNHFRHDRAREELNRALSIAKAHSLADQTMLVTIDLARSELETGGYVSARSMLAGLTKTGAGRDLTNARLRLGQVYTRLGDFAAARTTLSDALQDIDRRNDAGQRPLYALAQGELEYESGNAREARSQWQRAAAFWRNDEPDAAAVEAMVHLAWLDAIEGRRGAASEAAQRSLLQAQKMGRPSLEAGSRVVLARVSIEAGRSGEALTRWLPSGTDQRGTFGVELDALAHYWRGRALAATGDAARASAERRAAQQLIQNLSGSWPLEDRRRFSTRPDISRILD